MTNLWNIGDFGFSGSLKLKQFEAAYNKLMIDEAWTWNNLMQLTINLNKLEVEKIDAAYNKLMIDEAWTWNNLNKLEVEKIDAAYNKLE